MESKIKKTTVTGYIANCEKCGYNWIYTKGIPKYWISCPKCKSKKNNINHEIFEKWHPEVNKKMKYYQSEEIKTPCKLTQTEQHRTIIYYSHSMQYYDTDTERKDMVFLSKQKNSTVINPNGMDLLGYDKKSMILYLLTVQKSDVVWYRDTTIGVVAECLTAVVLNKKVYSLETRKPITQSKILKLSELFKNNTYCESDKRLIKNLFGNSVYKRFLILLEGGF